MRFLIGMPSVLIAYSVASWLGVDGGPAVLAVWVIGVVTGALVMVRDGHWGTEDQDLED